MESSSYKRCPTSAENVENLLKQDHFLLIHCPDIFGYDSIKLLLSCLVLLR